MRILLFILLFSFNASAQVVGFMPVYSATSTYPATITGVVYDDGYYNGFPFTDTLSNGDIFSVHKNSGSHADKGPMLFLQSDDGGLTNDAHQVTVNGTPIECAALSMCRLASGRIVIAYQDDETYTYIKFAYSDNEGVSFTYADSLYFGTGYSTSPSPVKMLVMPSGKIRMGYYAFGLGANPAIVGFLNSTDNGESWSVGESIISAGGTGYGDEKGHEFGFVITDNTGVDSTCKMISIIRGSPSGGLFYYSANGGATWNTSFTEDAGTGGPFSRHLLYPFGNATGAAPFDIVEHNDSIYVVTGKRVASPSADYSLQIIKASKADAYVNIKSTWSAVDTLRHYNAESLGSDVDCGYPVFFKTRNGLFVRDYDVSTETRNPAITEDRCWIYQYKIAD